MVIFFVPSEPHWGWKKNCSFLSWVQMRSVLRESCFWITEHQSWRSLEIFDSGLQKNLRVPEDFVVWTGSGGGFG